MAKINPADRVTAHYMEIQNESGTRAQLADTLIVVVCAVILLFFGLFIWLLPHPSFSPDENRTLTEFPEFSLTAITKGSYTAAVGSFYSDHFPLRQYFVGAKAVCELAQLKMQNNDVIPAKGGNIIERLEYTGYSNIEKNLNAIQDFAVTLEQLNVPFAVALAPRSVDVLKSHISPLFGDERSGRVWEEIKKANIDNVDLLSPLKNLADMGEYVFYRTDHHWTTYGAYIAYVELADALGYNPCPLSDFNIVTASDEFYGTTWSSSGMRWTEPDKIELYRFPNDEEYTVEYVLDGSTMTGFYDTDYLETKDKYSAFIGGNHAHVRIKSSDNRPTLLIIKDSYAHSLAPFLAIHFNLEIIDLRYFVGSTGALAKGADAALLLYGVDNLALSDDLTLLRYGLNSALIQ